jgi:hypothetical protein
MKQLLLLLVIQCLAYTAYGQSRLVEDKTTNLQLGLLGAYFNHEVPLANTLALRLEVGLDAGLFGGSFNGGLGYLVVPAITAEPRWYYNLAKRHEENKRIDGNSGNFLTLHISHHPNWVALSNRANLSVIPDLWVVPTWGIRRNLGEKYNFETGLGIGYRGYFHEYGGYENSGAINLVLRFGYRVRN